MNNSPECCQNCRNLKENGGCRSKDKFCPMWLEWFYAEWAGIQEAARRLKQKRAEKEREQGGIAP